MIDTHEIQFSEEMLLRNSRIKFIENTHTYIIDDCPAPNYTSVTTFIKQFFPQFDAKLAISKMKTSGSFQKRFKTRSEESVIDEWATNGRIAGELGTRLHSCIENTYNHIEMDEDYTFEVKKEYQQFLKFYNDTRNSLIPFAFEWRVFNEDLKIAGSIDAVFIKNGKFVIYDWKRVKEIKTDNQYENAFSPINYLDNCNFNQYSLQLNMYKYILETKYGITIDELALIIMYPTQRKYIFLKLPCMRFEIENMLAAAKLNTGDDTENLSVDEEKLEEIPGAANL